MAGSRLPWHWILRLFPWLAWAWRFDEGQGSETYDSTGLSPTAEIFSGITWAEGMGGSYNTALKFDGGSFSYVDLGDFRLEGSLSFSAWV